MNTEKAQSNESMGWNDSLAQDGQNQPILAEGDYIFTVADLIKGEYDGGAKLPACPKATVKLDVMTDNGNVTVFVTLYLHRSLEWRLSSFFRCIGMKRRGEEIIMDWDHVVGKSGRAHFRPKSYKDQFGDTQQSVEVTRFYDYDPDTMDCWLEVPDDDNPFNGDFS